MSRADQFAVGIALMIVALTVVIHNDLAACVLLLLGLAIIGRIYWLDWRFGANRPTLNEIVFGIHAEEYKKKLIEDPGFGRWVDYISKPKSWKRYIFPVLIAAILLAFIVTEAWPLRFWNQWVLESYNQETGYVFRKGGARYIAHCAGALATIPTGFVLDISSAQLKPEIVCSSVLEYLHKPVPIEQSNSSGSVLSVAMPNNPPNSRSVDFLITEAK